MTRIQNLRPDDRPRERLQRLGAKALSDTELIAIVLGSGGRGYGVETIAGKIVAAVDALNGGLHVAALQEIPGVGLAKACAVVAGLEFARRRIRAEGHRVREAGDVLPLVGHLADRKQETFICVSLNGAHEVIASRIVTVGLVNACQVHPREVFADPIADRAAAVIVAHNHPSGDLTPSREDLQVTERLRAAADVLGLRFLDHVIFSRKGYYSIGARAGSTLGGAVTA